ncbi:uncharacterized protein [Clytia hemisphaerica]|uniref:uncharacterized protein n=1 Tax=Clytia hemisphaerica TaxID=252671 RepID=UPI0034D5AE23
MYNEIVNKKDLYTVHIGNLNSKVTIEELKILFVGTGDVRDIYIQDKFSTNFTYAFVRFKTIEECVNACTQLHGTILHGSAIWVTLAESTTNRINNKPSQRSSNKDRSILKPSQPRREGAHYVSSQKDENEIHKKLTDSLTELKKDNELTRWIGIDRNDEAEVQNYMVDFKDGLVAMAKIPEAVGVEAKSFEKTQDMDDLQKLIISHHSCATPSEEYLPFKNIDFDARAKK